jgi:hypothetical protein
MIPSCSEYQKCGFSNPKQGPAFKALNLPFGLPNLLSLGLQGALREINGFLAARTNVLPVELV